MQLELVKGLQGRWHITDGSWAENDKLATLCKRAISPNYRRMDTKSMNAQNTCPKCREVKSDLVIESKVVMYTIRVDSWDYFPFLCRHCGKVDESKDYLIFYFGKDPNEHCVHFDCLKDYFCSQWIS